uniref:Uncharacterized protein n=1 Tax=Globodera rostochiensis TaxID=31243 RepID=A0A914GV75_GLORO
MPVIKLSALDNTQLRKRKLAVPHQDIMLGVDVLPSGFTLSQSKTENSERIRPHRHGPRSERHLHPLSARPNCKTNSPTVKQTTKCPTSTRRRTPKNDERLPCLHSASNVHVKNGLDHLNSPENLEYGRPSMRDSANNKKAAIQQGQKPSIEVARHQKHRGAYKFSANKQEPNKIPWKSDLACRRTFQEKSPVRENRTSHPKPWIFSGTRRQPSTTPGPTRQSAFPQEPATNGKSTTTPSSQKQGFRPDTLDYRSFKFNQHKQTLELANSHRDHADKPVGLTRLQSCVQPTNVSRTIWRSRNSERQHFQQFL